MPGQLVENGLTRGGVVGEQQAPAIELQCQCRHHRADAVVQVTLQPTALLLPGGEQTRP